MNEPLWLSGVQLSVQNKKMTVGYASIQFIQNADRIFFVSPTIAPVDYTPKEPDFLEHPEAAFSYFAERGLKRVVAENKYMGSRAQILAFRSPERALKGHKPVRIVSRSGADFFPAGSEYPEMLRRELAASMDAMGVDFVILDGEILPWALKAKGLIEGDFLSPGECAYVSRSYCHGEDAPQTQRAKRFLEALAWFTADTPVEYRVWQVLAMGTVQRNRLVTRHMGAYMSAEDRYALIGRFESEHVKCVQYRFVDLQSAEDRRAAVAEWERYCLGTEGGGRGEGWVVKVLPTLCQFDDSGKAMLPMVKVRGKDYLRIIYGIDYLEPECFSRVAQRKIGGKRLLSRKQHELADNVLKCFLNGHHIERLRFASAFYGVEETSTLNATL